MNIADITKLISLVLAISVAGERLIALIKSFIPWLAVQDPPNAPNDENTIARKVILILLMFGACLLTTIMIHGTFSDAPIDIGGSIGKVSTYVISLMASGGSAFWTSLLTYVKSVGSIKVEQFNQARLQTIQLRQSNFTGHNNWVSSALLRVRTERGRNSI